MFAFSNARESVVPPPLPFPLPLVVPLPFVVPFPLGSALPLPFGDDGLVLVGVEGALSCFLQASRVAQHNAQMSIKDFTGWRFVLLQQGKYCAKKGAGGRKQTRIFRGAFSTMTVIFIQICFWCICWPLYAVSIPLAAILRVMSIRPLFLLLCCLLSVAGYAQKGFSEDYTLWSVAPGDSRYIFADTAYIRASASVRDAPLDTLLAGDEVKITAIVKQPFSIKGFTARWLNVTYTKGGAQKNGYVWEGLISFTPMRRGATKFVYGLNRMTDSISGKGDDEFKSKVYHIGLKVVLENAVVASAMFRMIADESAGFTEASAMAGQGLEGVSNIIRLTFSGEACGIPTYHYYYAWTGKQLLPLPQLMEVGDAGVYYHTEKFVFPSEKGGKPGMILLLSEDAEETGKVDKKGEPVYKEERKTLRYKWDGAKATLLK